MTRWTLSRSESKRFGMSVFRYEADTLNCDVLEVSILNEAADLTICRVPARDLARLSGLALPHLVGDILVNYSIRLERPRPVHPDLTFLRCEDDAELSSVARVVFAGYRNHYTANPRLAPEAVLEGMVEWAASYVGQPDKAAFLPRLDGQTVGFYTARYGPDAEMVLGGTLPEARGKGVYRDMLRHAMNTAIDLGCERLLVSTQVHNTTVQRVWIDEGFTLGEPLVTFHVMLT